MEVQKGYLIRTYQGDLGQQLAQVKLRADEVIDDVLMLYPYGFASRMQREEQEGSMVLLLKIGGSKTNIFGIPYNPLFFQDLEETEVKIGNPKQKNTVTFKANGDIEVTTQQNININASKNIDLSNSESKTIKINDGGNIEINSKTGKIEINNDLETLNSLLTQLITVLQNFISVDNPVTPTITVQPSTATLASLATLQANFNKLIG